mmetsp:Transcript_11861/g.37690  ORF Transcript_11861/g.37690 Transcript_11861/m.37690 type:complete len:230 (+) Transcript_11861:4066-4755(+)
MSLSSRVVRLSRPVPTALMGTRRFSRASRQARCTRFAFSSGSGQRRQTRAPSLTWPWPLTLLSRCRLSFARTAATRCRPCPPRRSNCRLRTTAVHPVAPWAPSPRIHCTCSSARVRRAKSLFPFRWVRPHRCTLRCVPSRRMRSCSSKLLRRGRTLSSGTALLTWAAPLPLRPPSLLARTPFACTRRRRHCLALLAAQPSALRLSRRRRVLRSRLLARTCHTRWTALPT